MRIWYSYGFIHLKIDLSINYYYLNKGWNDQALIMQADLRL